MPLTQIGRIGTAELLYHSSQSLADRIIFTSASEKPFTECRFMHIPSGEKRPPPKLREHDNFCSHRNSPVQIHDVGIVHSNAPVRDEVADRARCVRAVDSVLATIKNQGGGTHRVSW